MTSPPDTCDIFTLPPEGIGTDAWDVFGPTVEFISFSNDDHNQICVMRGVIPPGVTVPFHSHADFEDFFIVSGTQQVLLPGTRAALAQRLRRGLCPGARRNLTPTETSRLRRQWNS